MRQTERARTPGPRAACRPGNAARRMKRRRKRRLALCAVSALCLATLVRALPMGNEERWAQDPAPQAQTVISDWGGQVPDAVRERAAEDPRAAAIVQDPSLCPQDLLDLLDTAPEALELVLDYPKKGAEAPVQSVGELTPGQLPQLFQWDVRWGYQAYGDTFLAVSGCGPTALSMVAAGLTGDDSLTPAAVAAWADANGYAGENGTSWELLRAGCTHFGLEAQELPLSASSVQGALEEGRPVICSVRPGDFTTAGHLIVLAGWRDGQVLVHDPNSSARSTWWDYSRVEPQIRNLWAYRAS